MSIYKVLLLASVVIFPWTITAEAQKEDAVKAEMKKLQGVWQMTKWSESDGKPGPADEIKGTTFEFKDDRVIRRSNGRARQPFKFTLDPTKKPKWLEFEAGPMTRLRELGIYKLEGDELTICVIIGGDSEKPAGRPTEFKANEQKGYALLVMKKVKK